MFEKKIILKKWPSVYHKNNSFEIFKLSSKTRKEIIGKLIILITIGDKKIIWKY